MPASGPEELVGQYLVKNIANPEAPYVGFSPGVGLSEDAYDEGEEEGGDLQVFRGLVKPVLADDLYKGELVDAEVQEFTPLWLRPTHGYVLTSSGFPVY